MTQYDLKPELIGREKELDGLKKDLGDALKGNGTTVLISGEAGVGKTRLVDELIKIAAAEDFRILTGSCVFESLTPFLPFREAFRSESLEALLEEKSPRVESVYLVTREGLLIKEYLRQEIELDSDIFSSMLTTIENFVKDSLSLMLGGEAEGSLNTLGYEDYRILLERGKYVNLAVIISGKESELLIKDMREIIRRVEEDLGHVLADWDGNEDVTKGLEEYLVPLIRSGKYDGIVFEKEDPKVRRDQIFENAVMGLQRLSERHPIILSLDDMQWADPSSMALVHYISRNLKGHRMLILCTYRPEEVSGEGRTAHPLIRTMELMDREALFSRLELQRLPETCLQDFLDSMLENNRFSDAFRDLIYNETEGNPLFVIEMVKLLIDEKVIENDRGIWHEVEDLSGVVIPSRVQTVITRRLNLLEKDERRILDYASVIGETFTSQVLTQALSMRRLDLLERLRTLERTHNVVHASNGGFRFDHSKIKEVLYNEIPGELKREYHLIIANVIESLNKNNLDAVIYELVQHYYLGGNHNRSLYYSVIAGQTALAGFAPEKALEFYARALDSIDRLGDDAAGTDRQSTKRSWILLKLYELGKLIGEWDAAYDYMDELLSHSEDIADNSRKVDAFSNKAELHSLRSEWVNAINDYTRALEIAESASYKYGSMRIYHGLGSVYQKMGEYQTASDYTRRYMELARALGLEIEIARAYRLFGVLSTMQGRSDEGMDYFNKCIDILSKTDNYTELAVTYTNMGVSYFAMGRFHKVIEQNEKVIEITSRIGDIRIKGYGYSNASEAYARLGDLDKAIEYASNALEIFTRIGELPMLGLVYMNFGIIHKNKNDWATSHDYFNKSISLLREQNVPYYLADSLYQLGSMLKLQDTPDSRAKCKEVLRESLEIYEGLKAEKYVKIVREELDGLE